MRRLSFYLLVVLVAFVQADYSRAQVDGQPGEGEPPNAALITISAPDDSGIVTITGAQGAVFPNAQVSIRNLFTGQTVYTAAAFNGAFSAEIYGPAQTPFAISPSASLPANLRDRPGSLAGGPATIIYGANPEPRTDTSRLTRLLLDGALDDWDAYAEADLGSGARALLNDDSLYIGLELADGVPDGASLVAVIGVDDITYELTVNPAVPQAALWRQIAPVEREAGAVAVTVAVSEAGDSLELRLSRAELGADFTTVTLEQTFFRARSEAVNVNTIGAAVPVYDEIDGIVYAGGRMSGDFSRFYVAGGLAAGASYWSASGRVNTLSLTGGTRLEIEMDVMLRVPDLSPSQTGLSLIGEIGLQPVTIGATGEHNIPALHANNGWSNVMTPSGLAVDNVRGDVVLGTTTAPPQQIIRRGDQLLAGLRFELEIPGGLPDGIYAPTFSGFAQIGDGDLFAWGDAGAFGDGGQPTRAELSRLPFTLTVGEVGAARLMWTLFYDHPSDGSRGILPEEDAGRAALSNRVRYNSDTYILTPGTYPLEPYLLNQLPNAYDMTLPPLLPLLFPGGRVRATITAPDGSVNDLPDASVTQSRLSTATLDERDAFGAQPPVDAYRLMTSSSSYQSYNFDQYGDYVVQLTGNVDDVSGNRYEGGGIYRVTIAERLNLTLGGLPGTPFEVGDALFVGGRIEPGFPADVTVRVRTFPLNDDPTDTTFDLTADRFGNFAGEPFAFDRAGEYLIDYNVRYTDGDGRLWAASQRSAGIIATPAEERTLVGRGQRGINGAVAGFRPAWFNTERYPPLEALADPNLLAAPRPNAPYFGGDVAFTPEGVTGGLNAVLNVQDSGGAYRDWLLSAAPDYVSAFGVPMAGLAHSDELPLLPVLAGALSDFGAALLPDFIVNRAYAYVSATRPDVTVRQYVQGGTDGGLQFHWDNDDPLNRQIGAGITGNRAGDYVFIFGGVVVRNAEANIRETTPYAALAIVVGEGEPARVAPALRGNEDRTTPPLLTVRGEAYDAFFHPTATRPAQVMVQGERLAIAGQVAPTAGATVDVTIIAPDGTRWHYQERTNESGYFYHPEHDMTADQVGRWRVQITTTPDNVSSMGRVALLPSGGVPGVGVDSAFDVYVVPPDAAVLDWSLNGDTNTSYAPGSRLNISVSIPAGWTQPSARYGLTTASYAMGADSLQVFASSVAYQYDPAALAADFPLETSGGGAGARGGDVVTLTFVVEAQSTEGEPLFGVRRLHIFHDRLVSFDAEAAIMAEDTEGE